ncbi:MAG: DNA-binding protein WhiA [Eubacteriales bacterium]|nr:DNA-binding protein WhiA [Eubacteriales bacterium]
MISFCEQVKEEISNILTSGTEHKKYIANKKENDYKEDLIRRFILQSHISDPKKEYHFEYVLDTKNEMLQVKKELLYFNIEAKEIIKNNKYLLYLKDAENISLLLSIIGASQAVLTFENERVVKDVRKGINRRVNFETANLMKSVSCGIKQIEEIKLLYEKYDKKALDEELVTICDARINNQEASLTELASIIGKGMTKSKINHKFIKIRKMIREDI